MNTVEKAYLAGILDGEGSISTNKGLKIRVGIIMTDEGVIRWIASVWGKKVSVQDRPDRRRLYSITVVSQEAATALRELLPYLRVKKQQAEVAIRLAELKAVNKHTGKAKIQNRPDQEKCANLLRTLKQGDVDYTLPEVKKGTRNAEVKR